MRKIYTLICWENGELYINIYPSKRCADALLYWGDYVYQVNDPSEYTDRACMFSLWVAGAESDEEYFGDAQYESHRRTIRAYIDKHSWPYLGSLT